jgi:hypothetical protein
MEHIRSCIPFCMHIVIVKPLILNSLASTWPDTHTHTHTHTMLHLLLKTNTPQALRCSNTPVDMQFLKTIAALNLYSVKTLLVLTTANRHFPLPHLTCIVHCDAGCDMSVSWEKSFPVPALHTTSKNLILIAINYNVLSPPNDKLEWWWDMQNSISDDWCELSDKVMSLYIIYIITTLTKRWNTNGKHVTLNIYVSNMYIQGVPGVTCQTSGGCSLC